MKTRQEKCEIREKVIDTIRKYFKDLGFLEAQTPILVPVPSAEPNLEVFETQLRTLRQAQGKRAYLITSPEYALKRLICAGMEKVFEITRSFRNEEEISVLHNPEFTILEWYETGVDYKKIMEEFEELFVKIVNGNVLTYQGQEYDINPPWPRISFEEAFQKYAGRNLAEVKDEDFYKIFFNEIEPKLRESRRPAFVYDYPVTQASLARVKKSDPRFAERWEVFLAGMELANCFSELTDPIEQEQRFIKDLALRRVQGKTEYPMDEAFIQALKKGMPECAGIAVGVDRLVMLVSDAATIGETMLFPAGELFGL